MDAIKTAQMTGDRERELEREREKGWEEERAKFVSQGTGAPSPVGRKPVPIPISVEASPVSPKPAPLSPSVVSGLTDRLSAISDRVRQVDEQHDDLRARLSRPHPYLSQAALDVPSHLYPAYTIKDDTNCVRLRVKPVACMSSEGEGAGGGFSADDVLPFMQVHLHRECHLAHKDWEAVGGRGVSVNSEDLTPTLTLEAEESECPVLTELGLVDSCQAIQPTLVFKAPLPPAMDPGPVRFDGYAEAGIEIAPYARPRGPLSPVDESRDSSGVFSTSLLHSGSMPQHMHVSMSIQEDTAREAEAQPEMHPTPRAPARTPSSTGERRPSLSMRAGRTLVPLPPTSETEPTEEKGEEASRPSTGEASPSRSPSRSPSVPSGGAEAEAEAEAEAVLDGMFLTEGVIPPMAPAPATAPVPPKPRRPRKARPQCLATCSVPDSSDHVMTTFVTSKPAGGFPTIDEAASEVEEREREKSGKGKRKNLTRVISMPGERVWESKKGGRVALAGACFGAGVHSWTVQVVSATGYDTLAVGVCQAEWTPRTSKGFDDVWRVSNIPRVKKQTSLCSGRVLCGQTIETGAILKCVLNMDARSLSVTVTPEVCVEGAENEAERQREYTFYGLPPVCRPYFYIHHGCSIGLV
ncbi:hypothetical protein KIPB_008540 [Kipferlia bialata]|uniref:Uncharacterized protein n=1 Tax=Kipferlia bialata TaxID=797122 RepID=A0A9K3D2J4_9EUKA|nr:hypothetical protein KIPB_008540 [Kipferlia bialata]|eukprot:g8540.t1